MYVYLCTYVRTYVRTYQLKVLLHVFNEPIYINNVIISVHACMNACIHTYRQNLVRILDKKGYHEIREN